MAINRRDRYGSRWAAPTPGHPQGAFINRSNSISQDGSYLERSWINDFSALFSSLLVNAGITPNGRVDGVGDSQYYDALLSIIQANGFPVGAPIAWFSSSIPAGYAPCDGRTFNRATFPILGAIFTSGRLPDLRGRVLKHVQVGRAVNTQEAQQTLSHSHNMDHKHTRGTQNILGVIKFPNNVIRGHENAFGLFLDEIAGFGSSMIDGPNNTILTVSLNAATNWTGSSSNPSTPNTSTSGGSENRVNNHGIQYIMRLA